MKFQKPISDPVDISDFDIELLGSNFIGYFISLLIGQSERHHQSSPRLLRNLKIVLEIKSD